MTLKQSPTLEVVKACCRALDDKKAGELAVLDVSQQSSITDYLVVASATSEPHLRALGIELEKVLDAAGVRIVGSERVQTSGWLVVDAFDVMFHLFLAPVRERYALERLWRDAVEVPVGPLLGLAPAKAPRKAKAPARPKVKAKAKAPVKRTTAPKGATKKPGAKQVGAAKAAKAAKPAKSAKAAKARASRS
jgi:ribosome-associated protein